MKTIIYTGIGLLGQLLIMQQSYAGDLNGIVVPEMDGAGVIIGIALVAGLVALLREKFFHK